MPKRDKPLRRILVANRGEIAVRIITTIQRMGMQAIAVYSDFDKNALHVKLADTAEYIGKSPASDSYLSIEKIIEAAKNSGADGIHPGYGFLSENSEFARDCEEANLIFIGPTPGSMEIMGDKASAKQQMLDCGITCIEGYRGEEQDDDAFERAARDIGYPLMVKAANGGGGRGMRFVEQSDQLLSALQEARNEAIGSFGSSKLILEKAIKNARHIEIQILGDTYGNLIHLGERDCSLQRRHQKVIEEAPSPAVGANLRERMGAAAVKAAKSVNYQGAGTVEFLLDKNDAFYFLEMNTRLQVEHPVTELVTGIDLVEWQIRIASGERLNLRQSDVEISGHAIEARLYAEDPGNGFMPSTGEIIYWREPQGNGIRVDSGIETGDQIGSHYDAMLAKVIFHHKNEDSSNSENSINADRHAARRGLLDALKNTILFGPNHNKAFLLDYLNNTDFISGQANINTIDLNDPFCTPQASNRIVCLASVLDYIERRSSSKSAAIPMSETLLNWSSSPLPPTRFRFGYGDQEFDIAVKVVNNGNYKVTCNNQQLLITLSGSKATIDRDILVSDQFIRAENNVFIACEGHEYRLKDLSKTSISNEDLGVHGTIISPMHGTLVEVSADIGANVEAGSRLAVLEAMKMRHEILAGATGVVKQVRAAPGTQVSAGEILIENDPEGSKDGTGN